MPAAKQKVNEEPAAKQKVDEEVAAEDEIQLELIDPTDSSFGLQLRLW